MFSKSKESNNVLTTSKLLPENDNSIYNESMTVCIAAITEEGKKAILVADKLVTSQGLLPYQVDMAADKIMKLSEHTQTHVMYCGGVSDAMTIIENSIKAGTEGKNVEEIANIVNSEHLKYLISILDRAQITGRGMESREWYYENHLKMHESLTNKIDSILETYTLNSQTQFIICGKSYNGMYKVYYLNTNPRLMPSPNISGYATIGSGGGFANFVMIQSKYEKTLDKDIVTQIVLKAKKESENDRDVGSSHDVLILE